jgi:predicted nucleotide-binding protein (sugar kinase/HSP70/actin superfamily)
VLGDLLKALNRGVRPALRCLRKSVQAFNAIPVDRSCQKPVVMILGEILVAVHPSSNYQLEYYLEENGMEVMGTRLSDFFHRGFLAGSEQKQHYFLQQPFFSMLFDHVGDELFTRSRKAVEAIMQTYLYYRPRPSAKELYSETRQYLEFMHLCGEGWLIPGEIMHAAKHNIQNFIIVQPFGCLPAHIYGRGMIQAVKQVYPQIQILPLDFDPDTSLGNTENRLQMFIMNARA